MQYSEKFYDIFFNDTATTEIYTLSLHDALPILAKCSGITQVGAACRGIPIEGSSHCYVHHPDHAEQRRRHGSKGGRRGGRGRPSTELARLQERFETLVDKVLSGEVERSVGAVVGQL